MLLSISRRRSPSITIERSGSLDACGRCDGGSCAGAGRLAAASLPPCGASVARVGDGGRAGIEPGDDRYADSSVTCASVSDETVARSGTCSRAQICRAVSYEIP